MATQEEIAARRKALDRIRLQTVTVTRYRRTPIRKKMVPRTTKVLKFPSLTSLACELQRLGYEGVSKESVRRDMIALKCKPKAKGRAPTHTQKQRDARYAFCIALQELKKKNPKLRLIWSDETWVHGSEATPHKTQWVKEGEETLANKYSRNDPKVMFWFAFNGNGDRRVVALPVGNGLSVTRAVMEKRCYAPNVKWIKDLNKKGFVFQEDGAKTHSKDYLAKKKVLVLPLNWPALTPELNVAEEFNAIAKFAIAKHLPYGHEEIEKAARKEIKKLPKQLFKKLEKLFWIKVAKCIEVKGDVVKVTRAERKRLGVELYGLGNKKR